jgi:hypothetical protein
MKAYTVEDHRKFIHALLTRDIRRAAAQVQRSEIDSNTREKIGPPLRKSRPDCGCWPSTTLTARS